MFFIDSFRLFFILSSFFLIAILILLAVYMYRKKNQYRKYIVWPIILGIVNIIIYSVFLICREHDAAVFFDTFFFIGIDWLVLSMLIFSIEYTKFFIEYKQIILIGFELLCTIDSVSLLVNNRTHHMFDLVLMTSKYGLDYWGNSFYPLHYVHLGLCYVIVFLSFFNLFLSVLKAPSICKQKYGSILLMYVVIIITNVFCYSLNLPFDFSVILYAVLASFLCYYSTYSYPHKLLSLTLKSVNDSVSDAIMYFDENGTCVYFNKSAWSLFENNHEFEPCLAEAYREKLNEELKENQNVLNTEDILKINGREHHFLVEYRKEFYRNCSIGSYIKLMDITEEFVSYRKERFIATHDSFTGILNRTGFFDAVDELIQEKGTFGYVMIISNIREFKMINESFGERIGDEVILKQAGMLRTFSHSSSIYGRICDDKFALYTKREYFVESEFIEYMKLMQRITERPLYQMKLAIGVYQPQGRVESAQSMYDKALFATLQIRDKVSNTFAYYDNDLMEKIVNEKTLTEDFKYAIAENQIEIFLQPILDDKNQIKGAEALSRWNHPVRGLLVPENFIDILEKTEVIYQLDEYVWNQAGRILQKWNQMGLEDKYIAVNVSVKDFFYTDIYKTFISIVDKYKIKPSNIHIEITEFVLMSDFAKALSFATLLQQAGFVVTIDNFGDGYSSLNMLKDFNVNVLKIGMNLLNKASDERRNQIILDAMVEMAEKIGIDVVAEGVETKEQYELLKKCNCRMFQGYYFAPPMTVSECEKLAKQNLK